MAKQVKTNALRALDAAKVTYQTHSYESNGEPLDGVTVAQAIGMDASKVYKTLATRDNSNAIHIFVIPAAKELDLKKAAKAAGVKSLSMLPLADLLKTTGYVRGGCSPIGMKKPYPIIIDERAQALETIVVSAGRIGLMMALAPGSLAALTHARYANLTT